MATPSPAALWGLVVASGVLTYLLRASFLFGIDFLDGFPPVVDRLLAFFPIAILSALIAPELLVVGGAVAPANPRLAAGLVAFLVAWYTDNILLTVVTGMATLWALLGV